MTKPYWIVIGCDGENVTDDSGGLVEFKDSASAVEKAEELLGEYGDGGEILVFRLTHVVSMPQPEIEVERVK